MRITVVTDNHTAYGASVLANPDYEERKIEFFNNVICSPENCKASHDRCYLRVSKSPAHNSLFEFTITMHGTNECGRMEQCFHRFIPHDPPTIEGEDELG